MRGRALGPPCVCSWTQTLLVVNSPGDQPVVGAPCAGHTLSSTGRRPRRPSFSAQARLSLGHRQRRREGIGLCSLGQDLLLDMELEVHADSAAAVGICRRSGIGRVRHLAVGQLRVQEKLRQGYFSLRKVVGTANPADLLTKVLGRQRPSAALGSLGSLAGDWTGRDGTEGVRRGRGVARLASQAASRISCSPLSGRGLRASCWRGNGLLAVLRGD